LESRLSSTIPNDNFPSFESKLAALPVPLPSLSLNGEIKGAKGVLGVREGICFFSVDGVVGVFGVKVGGFELLNAFAAIGGVGVADEAPRPKGLDGAEEGIGTFFI